MTTKKIPAPTQPEPEKPEEERPNGPAAEPEIGDPAPRPEPDTGVIIPRA